MAAAAALAVSPAWAAAASPLTDDSVADFGGGTPTNAWVVEPGSVRLQPTGAALNFDGNALPAGWDAAQWTPPAGGATVDGGSLTVDGARVNPAAAASANAPQTLEFRATFGTEAFQHVGLGTDFNNPPWAMFSTGGGALPVGLYARTLGTSAAENTPLTGISPTTAHLYRIEWTAANVQYYVDGNLVATHASIGGPMRPVVSDFAAGGTPAQTVKVDWLGMSPSPASGTFESRVHDAGSTKAVWGALTGTGAGVTYATRSGNTAAPDASWSAYEPLGTGDAIKSPPGRYLQYKATLTPDASSTAGPVLDKVDLAYALDETAPTVTIGGVAVNGSAATVTFSSPDADVARFECSLDAAAFAACTSPKQLAGLAAGGHTLAVRALDRAGNTGVAASRSFTIAKPPTTGGGGTKPPAGGGTVTDKVAPVVKVAKRTVRVSRRGTFTMKLRCPRAEKVCKVDVQIQRRGIVIAAKKAKIAGGTKRTLRLRLSKDARHELADRRRMKVRATVFATDAAGNSATRSAKLKLLAPRR